MKKTRQFDTNELPDFLEELKKDNPFRIPHNYFSTVPDQIMQRIQEERANARTNQWQRWLTKWYPLLSPKPVWALAVVLIIAGIFFFNTPNFDSSQVLVDDFSAVEIAQYVQSHIDDFEVSDFYAQDIGDIEILSEMIQTEEIEPLMDDLMDDMDLETLQRIL